MAETLLQIQFAFTMTAAEYRALAAHVAHAIADVPGLRWKVWHIDESRGEAGGVYLFESQQAADAYLGGPIVGAVKSNPDIRDVTVKASDVLTDATMITRGPIGATTTVA